VATMDARSAAADAPRVSGVTLGPGEPPAAPEHPRASRRTEITRAAFELFAERGFRGASLEQVAQRVGLTKAGVLHYFPSKDALLVAVLAERDRDSASAATVPPDAVDALHAKLAALRSVVAQNTLQPGLVQAFTVLSAESVTDDHPAQPWFRQRYRYGRRHLAEAVTVDTGLSAHDALRAAALLLAVMDGLQLQWLLDPQEVDMVDAFDLVTELFEQLAGRSDGEH
jgi:AcrR family transcriptional regulator